MGYLARGPSSLTREAAGISFAKCTPNPDFFFAFVSRPATLSRIRERLGAETFREVGERVP